MFVLIGTAGSPGTYCIALERKEFRKIFSEGAPKQGGHPPSAGRAESGALDNQNCPAQRTA